MSAELEILGITRATKDSWQQPRDEVVDVSAYTEGAIVCTIFNGNVTGTTEVWIDTAAQNAEERWNHVTKLCSITGGPSAPETHYVYLQGPGMGHDIRGFSKYLRVSIEQNPGDDLTLDVQAIMKP